MISWCIAVLTFHICIEDLRFLKVRNIETALFLALSLLELNATSIQIALPASVISSFFFLILRIGMGDLKLWLVLIATQGELVLSMVFLERALAIAVLLVTVLYIKGGSRESSIAFAPVLLIPFLSLYLAI